LPCAGLLAMLNAWEAGLAAVARQISGTAGSSALPDGVRAPLVCAPLP
jgi:hypothetical protein